MMMIPPVTYNNFQIWWKGHQLDNHVSPVLEITLHLRGHFKVRLDYVFVVSQAVIQGNIMRQEIA